MAFAPCWLVHAAPAVRGRLSSTRLAARSSALLASAVTGTPVCSDFGTLPIVFWLRAPSFSPLPRRFISENNQAQNGDSHCEVATADTRDTRGASAHIPDVRLQYA